MPCVKCDARGVLAYLHQLVPVFPTGTKELPIGLKLRGDSLELTSQHSCIIYTKLLVDNCDNADLDITFIYKNVVGLLAGANQLTISIDPVGLEMITDTASVKFQIGFSTTEVPDVGESKYITIFEEESIDNLKILINTRLEALLKQSKPIVIYDGCAVLQYGSIIYKIKCPEFNFRATIDLLHCKIICNFNPKQYCVLPNGFILFKRDNSILEIPYVRAEENKEFVKIVNSLEVVTQLNFKAYADKILIMQKATGANKCTLSFAKNGLRTSVRESNVVTEYAIGDVTDIVAVALLPLALWASVLKSVGESTVEILYEGGILCLRTTKLIVLISAIS